MDGAHQAASRVLIIAALVLAMLGLAVVATPHFAPKAHANQWDKPITSWTLLPPPSQPPTTTTTTKPKPKPHVPVVTRLATPKGEIATFDRPGGSVVGRAGYWFGYQMTMPIVERQGDWLRIMLPERPNGKTGWVKRSDVMITSTAYRIVINRDSTRLTVYESGFPLFSAPVGLGKAATPTPLGHGFVAVVERPGPPGLGPVVHNTSIHSEAIQSWKGSGDAIIATHGPVSKKSAEQIGTTGTYISNGCVRMHEADQLKMDVVPVGSPIDIIP